MKKYTILNTIYCTQYENVHYTVHNMKKYTTEHNILYTIWKSTLHCTQYEKVHYTEHNMKKYTTLIALVKVSTWFI